MRSTCNPTAPINNGLRKRYEGIQLRIMIRDCSRLKNITVLPCWFICKGADLLFSQGDFAFYLVRSRVAVCTFGHVLRQLPHGKLTDFFFVTTHVETCFGTLLCRLDIAKMYQDLNQSKCHFLPSRFFKPLRHVIPKLCRPTPVCFFAERKRSIKRAEVSLDVFTTQNRRNRKFTSQQQAVLRQEKGLVPSDLLRLQILLSQTFLFVMYQC